MPGQVLEIRRQLVSTGSLGTTPYIWVSILLGVHLFLRVEEIVDIKVDAVQDRQPCGIVPSNELTPKFRAPDQAVELEDLPYRSTPNASRYRHRTDTVNRRMERALTVEPPTCTPVSRLSRTCQAIFFC